MKFARRPILVALAALLAGLSGCQPSTRVSTVWKTPEPIGEPFNKIMALVANASAAERRAGEDEMVRALGPARAVASYPFIADEQVQDREYIFDVVKREGIDGVAVIRLVSSDQKTTYVPPTYGAYTDPFNYRGPDFTYRGGYTNIDTIVTVETSVYSVRREKLIWAGSSQTYNPANIQDLVEQVCRGSVEELKREGFIK